METNIGTLESDLRYESRKFPAQLVVGAAAGNYFARHEPPTPPQVIVVQVPAAQAAHP